MTSLLLTGSTGFIGSAIHRQLAGRPDVRLRLLSRTGSAPGRPADVVRGDLTDASWPPGLCDGVDVIVHAASYVGADPLLAEQVNHEGTAHLIAEARRAGVPACVYVSTASVYGRGPHRGITENSVAPSPQSPVSSSRLAAETLIRAAGGTVVRPHLVYGPGDRWVVPSMVRLLAALPGWVDDGAARMSMIQVDDLARLVCALALHPSVRSAGAVHHANHPQPVTVREAGEALRRHLAITLPTTTMEYEEILRRLPDGVRERHLDMISFDHWYASQRLWQLTGCRPGRAFPHDLGDAAAWYSGLAPQPPSGHIA